MKRLFIQRFSVSGPDTLTVTITPHYDGVNVDYADVVATLETYNITNVFENSVDVSNTWVISGQTATKRFYTDQNLELMVQNENYDFLTYRLIIGYFPSDASHFVFLNKEMKVSSASKDRTLEEMNEDLSTALATSITKVTIPDKLWTNPSPHASFGKQTINVPNLNKYDYIEVFFKNWVQGHYGFMSTKCPVANGNAFALCYTICLYNGTTASTPHFGERLGTLNTTNNQITFENNFGCVCNSSPPTANSSNAWGVPQFILGYKFSQGGN